MTKTNKKLIIRPPQCYYCSTKLKWTDERCPKCGKLTPHMGKDWNKS